MRESIFAITAGSDSIISVRAEGENAPCRILGRRRAATQGKMESESSRPTASSTRRAAVEELDDMSGI
jgi:hypothetical protein